MVVADGLPKGQLARRELLQAVDRAIEADLHSLKERHVAADFRLLILSREQACVFRPLGPEARPQAWRNLRYQVMTNQEIEQLAAISYRLRQDRELSFYGDDQTDTPAEQLYSQDHASTALADAQLVLQRCEEFIEGPVSTA